MFSLEFLTTAIVVVLIPGTGVTALASLLVFTAVGVTLIHQLIGYPQWATMPQQRTSWIWFLFRNILYNPVAPEGFFLGPEILIVRIPVAVFLAGFLVHIFRKQKNIWLVPIPIFLWVSWGTIGLLIDIVTGM